MIFFTEDRQETGYARCANVPVEPKPVEDEYETEAAKKKKGIQLTGLDLEKAKLDVELKGVKQTLEPPQPKSTRERLRSRVGSKTELEDEVRQLHAEVDEKHKDDPVEREKRHRIIDDEARKLL